MAKGVTRFFWVLAIVFSLLPPPPLEKMVVHWIWLIISHGELMGSGNPDVASQTSVMLRRYRARSKPALQIIQSNGGVKNADSVLEEILALEEQARRLYEIREMFLPRLLKWDDRNSMAFSVEGRYPFLDHELIELCLSFAPQTPL